MQDFHNSFKFDRVLCHIDLEGSRAYAKALCKSGLLTKDELRKMLKGLDQVSSSSIFLYTLVFEVIDGCGVWMGETVSTEYDRTAPTR